jgi:hypothetical protein
MALWAGGLTGIPLRHLGHSSYVAPMNLATPVAVLFVASMVSMVVALIAFLLEVRIAIAVLCIGSW